ncbi:Na+/H+ antiporter subunit G [Corynebacterium mayonis]|uniref:Na+/H+ antiporter subunit G n=1 Tax=Corynebacterium mayonis TaxID=3062461 RepID=UPI0031407AEC
MLIGEIIAAALAVIATVFTVAATVLQLRAPDALSRVNLLGPLTVVALPLLIVAKLIHSWSVAGFDLNDFLRAIIAIAGVWIVGSVAGFVMGRSIHGVTYVDKQAQ